MANCLEQNSIMYGLVRVTETTEGRDDGRGGTGKEKFCCVKWAPEDGTTPQRTPELQVFVVGQGGGGRVFIYVDPSSRGLVWRKAFQEKRRRVIGLGKEVRVNGGGISKERLASRCSLLLLGNTSKLEISDSPRGLNQVETFSPSAISVKYRRVRVAPVSFVP